MKPINILTIAAGIVSFAIVGLCATSSFALMKQKHKCDPKGPCENLGCRNGHQEYRVTDLVKRCVPVKCDETCNLMGQVSCQSSVYWWNGSGCTGSSQGPFLIPTTRSSCN